MQLARGPNTVWVEQVSVVSNTFSTTYLPDDGSYTLYATCGSAKNVAFCVGSSLKGSTEMFESLLASLHRCIRPSDDSQPNGEALRLEETL